MKPDDLPLEQTARLVDEASRCVACGLCLPHCPTYRITLSEADSPRGRIALMRGALERQIPFNARLLEHLDLCLTCRACESACPNSVAYGRLISGVRAEIRRSRPPGILRGLVLREFAAKPRRIEKLAPLLRFYRNSGLQALLRKSGLLRRLRLERSERYLPVPASFAPLRESYPAQGQARGEAGLFLGCVARIADSATLRAAIFTLTRLGYAVQVPRGQTCCGALHRRYGDAGSAARLAAENRKAFGGRGLCAVIGTASGCGAELGEQCGGLPVHDISAFLDRAEGWEGIAVAPLAQRVALHDPCTLRNVTREHVHPYRLLERIPRIEVVALAGNDQCCGAAGSYFLDQPQMADRLLADKVAALRECGAKYLVTSNFGCALHLAAGIADAGLDIEVLHPVTLLARQMGFRGSL